jgi:hypothetical protein
MQSGKDAKPQSRRIYCREAEDTEEQRKIFNAKRQSRLLLAIDYRLSAID